MKRKKKKNSRRSAPVKKKKAPARAPAAPSKKRKPKKTLVSASVPNPVARTFVVINDTGSAFLCEDETFKTDATQAKLYETLEAAQATVDGNMILAEPDSLFQTARAVPARTVLAPHYVFDLVDGEYLLSVYVRAKDDPEAITFSAARSLIRNGLKTAARDIAIKTRVFEKTWG